MYPDSIDATNYKYIKVDDKYIVSLMLRSLPEKIYFLDVVQDIGKNIEYDMSIHIAKQDTIKTLNKLTYNITNLKTEINTINRNQKNIDVIYKAEEETIALRKKLQLENQELFKVSIIVTFYSYNLNQIQKIISSFKAKLYSRQIKSDITNFRHLDFFYTNLPINIKTKLMHNISLTTDALANIFPFYTKNILDFNGVSIGYNAEDKTMCSIEFFSSKYPNSNMCIFGSSGSGKSFFTKLLICRNYIKNRRQIIFDVENEYSFLVEKFEGELITSKDRYNILQIYENEVEDDFLTKKINRVIDFIFKYCNTKDISREEFEEELKNLYHSYDITKDINTIFSYQDEEKVFLDKQIISKDKFPTLNTLKDTTKNNKLKEFLNENTNGVLRFFSDTTSFNLNNNLYVINVDNLLSIEGMTGIILDNVLDIFKTSTETIIYIDEMWKYTKEEMVLNSILELYKTIRKRKACIITITQDLTDLFKLDDGLYANGILNNSAFKMFFKTSYKNEEIFNQIIEIPTKNIVNLNKGEAFFILDGNYLLLKIQASSFESEILNEDISSNK